MSVYYSDLYKAVWFWKDDTLEYDKFEDANILNETQARHLTKKSDTTLQFLENVDESKQKLFKKKYRRLYRQHVPCVVTIQDIKDSVTYLARGRIPKYFLELFHSYEINNLLRALMVYFQLYLQVKEDLNYRNKSYATHLKHPSAIERETICKNQLSSLRSRIGQKYALLITGSGIYNHFHYMNKTTSNRPSTNGDIELFSLLLSFSSRVVWIGLGRIYFKEIKSELSRLFGSKETKFNSYLIDSKTLYDQEILYGKIKAGTKTWSTLSPIITDIYLNRDKHEISTKNFSIDKLQNIIFGLEALLSLPEELFETFGLVLGILGQPREKFDPMLYLKKQSREKSKEVNLAATSIVFFEPPEKPWTKLHQYLNQLDNVIALNQHITEQIKLYEIYQKEDSDIALALWKEM